MPRPIKILGLAGSLRRHSYNRFALLAAASQLPTGVTLEVFELDGIPAFNEDDVRPMPPRVTELKDRIRAADAILFATPEYNYSIPGVLKNAIDWASMPFGDSAWNGKPAAVMGASRGLLGTARAQYHLRQVGVFLNMHFVNQPEVFIATADNKFDESGHLTDDTTGDFIRLLVGNLVDWTRRLMPTGSQPG